MAEGKKWHKLRCCSMCVCVYAIVRLLETEVIWSSFQNVLYTIHIQSIHILYGVQLRRKSHNMRRYYENLILPFILFLSLIRLLVCPLSGCFVCIAALIVFYSSLGSEAMMLFISNTTIVECEFTIELRCAQCDTAPLDNSAVQVTNT